MTIPMTELQKLCHLFFGSEDILILLLVGLQSSNKYMARVLYTPKEYSAPEGTWSKKIFFQKWTFLKNTIYRVLNLRLCGILLYFFYFTRFIYNFQTLLGNMSSLRISYLFTCDPQIHFNYRTNSPKCSIL